MVPMLQCGLLRSNFSFAIIKILQKLKMMGKGEPLPEG
jgi:hypothetical protein